MKGLKYRITTRGLLDESWSAYFSGMTISGEPGGTTGITGEIADQSALHGLLNKVRDLNLEIVSVLLLDVDGVTPVECRLCGKNKPLNTSFGR
jgi:hypothetical protein